MVRAEAKTEKPEADDDVSMRAVDALRAPLVDDKNGSGRAVKDDADMRKGWRCFDKSGLHVSPNSRM